MLWRWMLEAQFWAPRNLPGYVTATRPGQLLAVVLIAYTLGLLIGTLLSLGEILRWRAGF